MNRKQRRASGIKTKPKTYVFTEEQLKAYRLSQFDEFFKKEKDKIFAEAFALMLTLPLEVLMDHYWTKSYEKRIPKFVSLILEYYEDFENGKLDLEEMKKDLWEYGRVRLEVTDD